MVQSAMVRNLPVDVNAIELQVAAELADAELMIMQQAAQVAQGKQLLSQLATPQRSAELRQVFRQLAKQLHPDVNPGLTPEQSEIWQIVHDAYKLGDLDKLKALQIVYEKEIANTGDLLLQLTESQLELRNEAMKEGIKQLQAEVEQIKSEFPFDIEQQLKDEDWVSAQQEAIKINISKLRGLEGELVLEFEALINGYGGTKPELN